MKKIYKNPETVIVELQAKQQMLAGSNEDVNLNNSNASEWGSRGGSFWDDDDDEY